LLRALGIKAWLVDYDSLANQLLKGQYRIHQSFLPEGFDGAITRLGIKAEVVDQAGGEGIDPDILHAFYSSDLIRPELVFVPLQALVLEANQYSTQQPHLKRVLLKGVAEPGGFGY
jgi:hypothetical protein